MKNDTAKSFTLQLCLDHLRATGMVRLVKIKRGEAIHKRLKCSNLINELP